MTVACGDQLESWVCQLGPDHVGRHADVNERGNIVMWSQDHTEVVERFRTV